MGSFMPRLVSPEIVGFGLIGWFSFWAEAVAHDAASAPTKAPNQVYRQFGSRRVKLDRAITSGLRPVTMGPPRSRRRFQPAPYASHMFPNKMEEHHDVKVSGA